MGLASKVALILFLFSQAIGAQSSCPPMSGRLVNVAPGVRLHVVEWGGKGETLLFLSGLNSSAHAFDDFAPFFVDRFRVVGITRRGIPPSDTSVSDYSASRLTSDILAVMDSLKIARAHVAGWSFGGNEAVMLAVNHPGRVRSLVLLDSYDNSPEAGTFKATAALKVPAQPWTSLDSSSVVAYTWRVRRSGTTPLSLRHYCASQKFGADGRFAGPSQSDFTVQSLRAAMPRLPYARVRQPVLAFFRHSRAVGDEYPDYANMDSANKAWASARFFPDSIAYAAARKRFRSELPKATVIELPGSTHAVFAFRPAVVVTEMISFYRRIQLRTVR